MNMVRALMQIVVPLWFCLDASQIERTGIWRWAKFPTIHVWRGRLFQWWSGWNL